MRDYTGYSFGELEELNVIAYWMYLRDAAIHAYMQTEAGRDYLENCWRLEQTEADADALRDSKLSI